MNRVILDLETTSAEKDKCRIVQLAIKQIDPSGKVLVSKSKLYNPGVPITPEATKAHGITDDMVKDCPSFYPDCKKLRKIFENSILVGYNLIVFDIPVLLYEFDRAGVPLNLSRKIIDVMKLETALSPRTLGAVYERYTGKSLEGAHDALADVLGTEVVLDHQMAKIEKNGLNEQELLEKAGLPPDAADFFGKLKYDDNGALYYNFGKWKGERVLRDNETKQYADWIIGNKEFASDVKKLLQDELKKSTKAQFTRAERHEEKLPLKQSNLFKDDIKELEGIDDLPF